jgi:hypothetical protein
MSRGDAPAVLSFATLAQQRYTVRHSCTCQLKHDGQGSERFNRRFPPPPQQRGFDYLIVGAGFAGSVLAERLARELGQRVLIVEKRGT